MPLLAETTEKRRERFSEASESVNPKVHYLDESINHFPALSPADGRRRLARRREKPQPAIYPPGNEFVVGHVVCCSSLSLSAVQ